MQSASLSMRSRTYSFKSSTQWRQSAKWFFRVQAANSACAVDLASARGHPPPPRFQRRLSSVVLDQAKSTSPLCAQPGRVSTSLRLLHSWWLCEWYSSNPSRTVQVLRRRPRGWRWMVRSAGKELVLVPDLHKIRVPFLLYSPRGPTQDCLVVDTSHACRTFRREPHHMAKKSLQLSPCSRWSLVPPHSGMRCRVLHLSFGAQGVSKGETPWTFLERCPWARPRKSSGTTGGRDGSTTRTQSNGRIRPSRL